MNSRLSPGFSAATDNGPEFVSPALLKWITDEGIRTSLIEPGKPWQNGTCESFNGKFSDECLSVEWSQPGGGTRDDREMAYALQRRPPAFVAGNLTPAKYAARLARGEITPQPGSPRTWPAMGRSRGKTGMAGRLKKPVVRKNRAVNSSIGRSTSSFSFTMRANRSPGLKPTVAQPESMIEPVENHLVMSDA
jgi:hypothetical protein